MMAAMPLTLHALAPWPGQKRSSSAASPCSTEAMSDVGVSSLPISEGHSMSACWARTGAKAALPTWFSPTAAARCCVCSRTRDLVPRGHPAGGEPFSDALANVAVQMTSCAEVPSSFGLAFSMCMASLGQMPAPPASGSSCIMTPLTRVTLSVAFVSFSRRLLAAAAETSVAYELAADRTSSTAPLQPCLWVATCPSTE